MQLYRYALVIRSFEELKTWLLLNCKFMSRAVYHFIL